MQIPAMNGVNSMPAASLSADSHRLLQLPVASLCNAGQHWMAPMRADGVAVEAPLVPEDVEFQLENCLYATQPRGLPEPRRVALCLMKVASKTCADGDDAWCPQALQRSASRMTARAATTLASAAEPGPVPVPAYRSLDALRQQVHPEFIGNFDYQARINALAASFTDLTGLDLKNLKEPVTVGDVMQVLADSDSAELLGQRTTLQRFDDSIRDAGWQMGELLGRIGTEVIDARPEVYDEALAGELQRWLPRHFPTADARPITPQQRRHVISLMVDDINEAIQLRSAALPAGGPPAD